MTFALGIAALCAVDGALALYPANRRRSLGTACSLLLAPPELPLEYDTNANDNDNINIKDTTGPECRCGARGVRRRRRAKKMADNQRTTITEDAQGK